MNGYYRNLARFFATINFTLGLAVSALAVCIHSAQAFAPEPGQIARFQPSLLKKNGAFSFTGSAVSAGQKMAVELSWIAPATYEVKVSGVPQLFYRSAQASSVWTLQRTPKGCVLRTSTLTVNCSEPTFWAKLEFSGQPDLTSKSLAEAGIFTNQDSTWSETDARNNKDVPNPRVLPRVGVNGATPVGVLEIRGKSFVDSAPGQAPASYPLIQFDPTFLTPLLTRFMYNGEVVQLRSTVDTEIRHGRTRFTYVYADAVEVGTPFAMFARFTRGEQKPSKRHELGPSSRASANLVVLEENLSPEGRNFLKALLLAH